MARSRRTSSTSSRNGWGRRHPSSRSCRDSTSRRRCEERRRTMAQLEVHAHLRVRPGQLEGFKAQAAELIRLSNEKDTQTIRYDWFISEDGTECEVHEAYVGAHGLVE